MKKILFVNACIRENDSRTLKLARKFLNCVSDKYEIEEIDLSSFELKSIDAKLYSQHQKDQFDKRAIQLATKFAEADKIVISAPFWDMSFPSVLKVFFERITIFGITFDNLPDGNTVGKCRADKLLYITTRGMDIKTGASLEQATPYIKALCYLWGIENFECISVSGTDTLSDEELDRRFLYAYKEIENIGKDF